MGLCQAYFEDSKRCKEMKQISMNRAEYIQSLNQAQTHEFDKHMSLKRERERERERGSASESEQEDLVRVQRVSKYCTSRVLGSCTVALYSNCPVFKS